MNLRERQAEAARALVRTAALAAFVEHGYVGTTMSDIAEAAGVARQTIYNLFESKAALLISVVNDRVVGTEARSQESDHRAIREATDPHQMIARFAGSTAGIADRSLPVLRIAYEAAALDGEVAKQLQLNEEQRFHAQSFFIEELDKKGFLRTDIPVEELKRGFWLLASPQTLLTAIDSGWTTATYITWLTQTVTGLLLAESPPV